MLAGSVAAVGVVLATVTFSSSLGALVDQPDRYGWPYDAAVVVGYGYGGLDHEAARATLDRPEVDGWGVAGLGTVVIKGDSVAAIGAGADFDRFPLPVIEGELPSEPGEVAVGLQTSEELDLRIGDELTVASDFGETSARVTGIVVLPSLGVFESDRAGTGTGVLLSAPLFDDLVGQGEDTFGLERGEIRSELDSFVGIDLQDDVDPDRFLADVGDELRSWDGYGFVPFPQPDPARPPQIADAAAMQTVPVALGGFFALAMAVGLAWGSRQRRASAAGSWRSCARWGAPAGRSPPPSAGTRSPSSPWPSWSACQSGSPSAARCTARSPMTSASSPRPWCRCPWTGLVVAATVAIGLLAAAHPARRSAHERTAVGAQERVALPPPITSGAMSASDMFDIAGKRAIVTGGGSGIGTMIATGFVEAGVSVIIASRKEDSLKEVTEELSAKGDCSYLVADLSTEDGLPRTSAPPWPTAGTRSTSS